MPPRRTPPHCTTTGLGVRVFVLIVLVLYTRPRGEPRKDPATLRNRLFLAGLHADAHVLYCLSYNMETTHGLSMR